MNNFSMKEINKNDLKNLLFVLRPICNWDTDEITNAFENIMKSLDELSDIATVQKSLELVISILDTYLDFSTFVSNIKIGSVLEFEIEEINLKRLEKTVQLLRSY